MPNPRRPIGRFTTEGNRSIKLLESTARTATTMVDAENTLNAGGTFIIDVTDAGTMQVETATVIATITIDGDIDVIVTSAILVGSPLTTTIAVLAGDDEEDVAGKIRTALALVSAITDDYTVGGTGAEVTLTTLIDAADDATLNIDVHFTPAVGVTDDTTSADTVAGASVAQIETATVVGTVTTAGALTVIITGALVAGSPLSMQVDVADSDTPTQQATKIRAAMNVAAITDNYTISGTGADIILTTDVVAANDATLNIDYHITTTIGLTDDTTSTDTTPGVGTLQVETATVVATITVDGFVTTIVTGALVAGTPLTIPVAVSNGDSASDVAGKVRAAMNIAAITDDYTLSGATDKIILTAIAPAANDATLNIDNHWTACVGPVDDTTSANTEAGVSSTQVETATVVGTVTGEGFIEVIVTGALVTGTPLTLPLILVLVDETPTIVAAKIRTEMNIAAIEDNYTISGAVADIILTADAAATDDATLNIDYHQTTATGLTDDTTSVDTTPGGTQQIETATLVGTVSTAGALTVIVTGALVTGTPLSMQVDVAASDTPTQVATKIRTAMNVAAITDDYTIGGAAADITLTTILSAANDATLNLDYHITSTIGVTDATTSANTTPGVAATVQQVETATVIATITIDGSINVIVTGNLVAGTPLTIPVVILNGDDQDAVAGKIRTALGIAAITGDYTVSGATDAVILTANVAAMDDATLNIDVHFTACAGPVDDTTSDDTVAGESVAQIETATAVATVTTSGQLELIITGALVAGTPLNIYMDVASSDNSSDVGGKIRTALGIAAITDNYTISGATDQVIMTADAVAANDATLNIDYHILTTIGLTDDNTSDNTTSGLIMSVVPTIQGYDRFSGNYYNILVGTAITTISTNTLSVYPTLTTSGNSVAKAVIPLNYRVLMTHANAAPAIYTVVFNSNR